mmetsp:Transcript_103921/g.222159  ORF Transcript_103921/g.222159 Transcript_103921/m.222159 type:complete len:249 (-) Transcript_103921:129-875(-)
MGSMQVPTSKPPRSMLALPLVKQSNGSNHSKSPSMSGCCAILDLNIASTSSASRPSTLSAFTRAKARNIVLSCTPMRRPLPKSMRTRYVMSCASPCARRSPMSCTFLFSVPVPETLPISKSLSKSTPTVRSSTPLSVFISALTLTSRFTNSAAVAKSSALPSLTSSSTFFSAPGLHSLNHSSIPLSKSFSPMRSLKPAAGGFNRQRQSLITTARSLVPDKLVKRARTCSWDSETDDADTFDKAFASSP